MAPFARKAARRSVLWLLSAAAVPAAAQVKLVPAIMQQAAEAGIEMPTAPQPAALALGENAAAPNFGLNDIDGKPVELAAYKGKVVLIEFWATWCGPCRASMPQVIELHNQYVPKGLVILAVNLNSAEKRGDLTQYLKDHPVPFTVLHDPGHVEPVVEAYDVDTIPKSVVVNKDGTIALSHSPFSAQAVAAAIEAALAK
jgi:thiol-disulfide isomerase/thioredoxin